MPQTSGESADVNNDELPVPECPRCYYNLTGLRENRCPECGGEFDPDRLRRLSSSQITRAVPWDRDRNLKGFTATWMLSVLTPDKMARDFPARHDGDAAIGYSIACYLCAAAAFFVGFTPWIVDHGAGVAAIALTAIFIATLTCLTCEIAVAGLLAGMVRPTSATDRYHFWRGQTHYTSGYAIISGVWGGICVAGASMDIEYFMTIGPIVAVGVFMSWCVALWRIVWERGRRGSRRIAACLLIPVIGAVSVGVGVLVAGRVIRGFF